MVELGKAFVTHVTHVTPPLMSSSAFLRQRTATRLHVALRCPRASCVSHSSRRHFFSFFRKPEAAPKKPGTSSGLDAGQPFSSVLQVPVPYAASTGEAIKRIAPCPVCTTSHEQGIPHEHPEPQNVQFECPDCGWPTHCSEEHWREDEEHKKYCLRLREANEDEHDLRSGRRMFEFELPGPQGYEEAISFANWDVFWYTRGFMSMDTERSRRHASKLLSYPITIGGALHQFSPLMLSNQRLTPEGSRSLAAIRSTLHVPLGAPETAEAQVGKPQVRIFILGARAESSPSSSRLGTIPETPKPPAQVAPSAAAAAGEAPQTSEAVPPASNTPPSDASPSQSSEAIGGRASKENRVSSECLQASAPVPIDRQKYTRNAINRYGVPSYTTPYTKELTITGLRTNYIDVHHHFSESLDPYSDAFFFFSPGFGFPSENSFAEDGVTPLPQIASPTEWGPVLPALLESKCPIFVTGFSPADVERDVRSLSEAPDVAGQFEWVVMPGPNTFSSEKWEISDFDPRVMIKANWGIWAIRGRSKDIQERSMLDGLLPWRR
ncbi:hypothetical protein MSAN_01276800 [Mycena sanguinolenta]|uniref:Uncharacterized protein n=1 Tax=Mycena sanguinolenta TaxID=230812 RepID=A0A8H6YDX7_9AGAR|nr:hypothetical protein MSAN_01276800 [Mycena sanguinolenta]